MQPNQIQEWIKAASAGEQTAWSALYKQYYPAAYASALRVCRDASTARDIVQDAFIIAYLKLPQLKSALSFGSWLRKIVMRSCYRSLNNKRRISHICFLPDETDSWWEDQITMKFEESFAQNRLYSALNELPESLRSALFLRYFSNYQSYEEIAAILSVPVGTVRSRLNQAKLKLAEHWNGQSDVSAGIVRQNEEWNNFYYSLYSGMHAHDDEKNKLLDHLDKNIRIILAKDKIHTGRKLFESIVADDRRAGSRLEPVNVLTCGSISVVEIKHYNSTEHPDHCPPSSVTVMYRNNGKASRMNLYLARK